MPVGSAGKPAAAAGTASGQPHAPGGGAQDGGGGPWPVHIDHWSGGKIGALVRFRLFFRTGVEELLDDEEEDEESGIAAMGCCL